MIGLAMRRRSFVETVGQTASQMTFGDISPFSEASRKTINDLLEEDRAYLSSQILTYLGNKRSLLRFIGSGVARVREELSKDKITFFDAFSGSGIVSRYIKKYASLIIANDLERYSQIVNKCYLTNRSEIDYAEFDEVFFDWKSYVAQHLEPGILSRLYAPIDDTNIKKGERVFYTRENAILLDSARAAIDIVVPAEYRYLILGPLLAEASIHANTSGVFKGFYKDKSGVGAFGGEGRNALQRICGRIELNKPVLSNFSCESMVLRGDANKVVVSLPEVDLAYFDPPYNQHPYGSNYFMLNVLAENKEPSAISKVSGIPKEWNHSLYNQRKEAERAFFELLSMTKAKYLMISYNSEGFIKYDSFMEFLHTLGEVQPIEIEYNTFRGCRNLQSRPLKVSEYIFIVKRI